MMKNLSLFLSILIALLGATAFSFGYFASDKRVDRVEVVHDNDMGKLERMVRDIHQYHKLPRKNR